MRILITGSSGYIGSVLCKLATEKGHTVIGVDTKRSTHKYFDHFINSDIGMNEVAYEATNYKVDAVFHLAASADVTDSTRRPSLYYHNNIGATAKLFDNLLLQGWSGPVIFSSTAAVYGPSNLPNIEKVNIDPPNAYGNSKWMCEEFFKDLYTINNIPTIAFRYFNVAGAYGDVGDHIDSHHVLQKLCYSAKNNQPFFMFGHELPTSDGSCVRDYIHVLDVCEAHFTALELLQKDPGYYTFNLGTMDGVSVKELATRFIERTGKNVKIKDAEPRPGDPFFLVANPTLFKRVTGFEYKHSNIDDIIDSAWDWYRRDHAV